MDIKLNEDNDRAIVDEMVTSDEELAQAIKLTLATNLAELEWNKAFGLSHQDILDNITNRDYILKQIEDCLAAHFDSFEHVKILSVDHDIDDRLLNLKLEVAMADGSIVTVDTGNERRESSDITY